MNEWVLWALGGLSLLVLVFFLLRLRVSPEAQAPRGDACAGRPLNWTRMVARG